MLILKLPLAIINSLPTGFTTPAVSLEAYGIVTFLSTGRISFSPTITLLTFPASASASTKPATLDCSIWTTDNSPAPLTTNSPVLTDFT